MQWASLTDDDWDRLLLAWRRDPVAFAEDVFGVRCWSGQKRFLRACAKNKRVVCRSGHKVSKTFSFAILAWWFVICFAGARVCIYAPRNSQLQNGVWREICKLHRRALENGMRFGCREPPMLPSRGITWVDDHASITCLAADGVHGQGESAAGLSGQNFAYMFDEASGIPPVVWEIGQTAPEGWLWAISNPTTASPDNDFFKVCQSDAWVQVHLSSEEAARENRKLAGGKFLYPGLATQGWIDTLSAAHAPDSYFMRVRVKGLFPLHSVENFWSPSLIKEAQLRYGAQPLDDLLIVGVDPAWADNGDETGRAIRRGNWCTTPPKFRGLTEEIVATTVKDVSDHRRGREPVRIVVDTSNNPGVAHGLAKHYRDIKDSAVQVCQCVASGKTELVDTDTGLTCAIMRDELWVRGRQWARNGGSLPPDPALVAQLLLPKWSVNSDGALSIESKRSIRKRNNGKSTDTADAFNLTHYVPVIVRHDQNLTARILAAKTTGRRT